eukprot:6937571-Pyramimonas_sp.AAC.3
MPRFPARRVSPEADAGASDIDWGGDDADATVRSNSRSRTPLPRRRRSVRTWPRTRVPQPRSPLALSRRGISGASLQDFRGTRRMLQRMVSPKADARRRRRKRSFLRRPDRTPPKAIQPAAASAADVSALLEMVTKLREQVDSLTKGQSEHRGKGDTHHRHGEDSSPADAPAQQPPRELTVRDIRQLLTSAARTPDNQDIPNEVLTATEQDDHAHFAQAFPEHRTPYWLTVAE